MRVHAFGVILELIKKNEQWAIYTIGEGKKYPSRDIAIPSELNESEVLTYLNDLFHEKASMENPEVFRID